MLIGSVSLHLFLLFKLIKGVIRLTISYRPGFSVFSVGDPLVVEARLQESVALANLGICEAFMN
jgi:hypothetical protein